jgi:hypothetical protein
MTKISPVLRGNLLGLSEKISLLHPSLTHAKMLRDLLLRAISLTEKSFPAQALELQELLKEIGSGYNDELFLKVMKESLVVIDGMVGEMVRPA